ncbi:MAG: late competence development ComFB family protein [Desulfovibrionaceae bacterium]|nr:late competence development ComFB family protein [Desulfovibrionaceae bacterium]
MSIFRDKYKMGDVDFFNIRNRNEGRVVKMLQEFLRNKGNSLISDKDLQDMYALTLNELPPRYTQRGTIVLRDPVTKREIFAALEDAYDQVMNRPKP